MLTCSRGVHMYIPAVLRKMLACASITMHKRLRTFVFATKTNMISAASELNKSRRQRGTKQQKRGTRFLDTHTREISMLLPGRERRMVRSMVFRMNRFFIRKIFIFALQCAIGDNNIGITQFRITVRVASRFRHFCLRLRRRFRTLGYMQRDITH